MEKSESRAWTLKPSCRTPFRDQGRFPGETGPKRPARPPGHHPSRSRHACAWVRAPSDSVTDQNCKLRGVENAYIAGPMVFPTIGSPNPMLTGTAFARRLATHLVQTMPHHVADSDAWLHLALRWQDARRMDHVHDPRRAGEE